MRTLLLDPGVSSRVMQAVADPLRGLPLALGRRRALDRRQVLDGGPQAGDGGKTPAGVSQFPWHGTRQATLRRMAVDPDCVFCRIAVGEHPAVRVAEDERTIAFLDAAPVMRGHAVVIPRQHAEGLEVIAAEDLEAVAGAAQRLAITMRERLGADGVNLVRARDRDGGAVHHVHLHVIPRFHGDALRLPWVSEPGDRDEIEAAGRELAG